MSDVLAVGAEDRGSEDHVWVISIQVLGHLVFVAPQAIIDPFNKAPRVVLKQEARRAEGLSGLSAVELS